MIQHPLPPVSSSQPEPFPLVLWPQRLRAKSWQERTGRWWGCGCWWCWKLPGSVLHQLRSRPGSSLMMIFRDTILLGSDSLAGALEMHGVVAVDEAPDVERLLLTVLDWVWVLEGIKESGEAILTDVSVSGWGKQSEGTASLWTDKEVSISSFCPMVIPVTLPCSFTDALFEVSVVDVVCDVLPETGTWLILLSFDISLAFELSRVTSWIFIFSEASFSGSSISMPTPSSVKEELNTVWSGGRESALSVQAWSWSGTFGLFISRNNSSPG